MKADHTITQDYVRLSSRRPVWAEPVPRQPDYPPHDHEIYEISLVTGGRRGMSPQMEKNRWRVVR